MALTYQISTQLSPIPVRKIEMELALHDRLLPLELAVDVKSIVRSKGRESSRVTRSFRFFNVFRKLSSLMRSSTGLAMDGTT